MRLLTLSQFKPAPAWPGLFHMNEEFDTNPTRSRSRENERGRANQRGFSSDGSSNGNGGSDRHHAAPVVDFWTCADLVAHRWHWIVIGAIIVGGLCLALGGLMLQPKFTATAELLRYESPGQSDFLKTPPLTPDTFAALIASPDLLKRVGERAQPPIPSDKLAKRLKVDPQPESEIVKVYLSAPTPQEAVTLANDYANEVVAYTKALQATQAERLANNYLVKRLVEMDQQVDELSDEFRKLAIPPEITNKLAEVGTNVSSIGHNLTVALQPGIAADQLQLQLGKAMAELSTLLAQYTDDNPLVRAKQEQIRSLTDLAAASETNSTGPSGTKLNPEFEIVRTKLNALDYARVDLAKQATEAQLYAADPPGDVRVNAAASQKTVKSSHRRLKIGALTILGGIFGMGCSLALLFLVEAFDSRLKNVDDLKRVARMPVLTSLGDLRDMKEAERAQWAFRTWTLLQGRLSRSANHGLVCGFTSSSEGEGRSTWIKLLAEAASLSGFRVLTIATKPAAHVGEANQITEETLEHHARLNGRVNGNGNENGSMKEDAVALATNVLAAPSRVTEQLTGPNSQPQVHIPLPGWVWNLERRKQWRSALGQWRQIENLVIFVELPPASVPEAVLLGSHLPNLVWLADGQMAKAGETKSQLETLRNARCNLVGAVLNREQGRTIKQRFPRWFAGLAIASALGSLSANAQETDISPSSAQRMAAPEAVSLETNSAQSFSVVSPTQRAPWQRHLTLGPGDVLTFALYGEPVLTRTEVPVGPDGRVSYLEAQDIQAAGLTVDELRSNFDRELGKYRRSPHIIITPTAYKSKKYYVLGHVVQRGVYVLDRPITVIEAIARARGFENGLIENDTLDLADLQHSFLMRAGKRVPLDFEKLFEAGDLSQNVLIEPDDYLYFPSANLKQVFVLGEVALPGPVVYRPDMTAVAAISSRGGFTDRAYKSRVLVLRGSLSHPQKYIVDVMAITKGRDPDFKLQPKDIVYVSYREFIYPEDLLDLATTAFIQSMVTTWVGTDVIKP